MAHASPELLARYTELLDVVPDAERRQMFGSPTCLVGRRMFFGVHPTGLFVRLPPAAAEELLAAGGTPFEPMPGRTMGGFFTLPAGLADHESWVRRSYEHTLAMPPKEPKEPNKPKEPKAARSQADGVSRRS